MALQKFIPFLKQNQTRIIYSVLFRHLSSSVKSSGSVQEKDKFTFDDKIAVVTGGASGLGLAISQELLRRGIMAVNILDIDEQKLKSTAKYLEEEFGDERILYNEVDVSDTEQMDKIFEQYSKDYDGIDLVINNAGIMNDTNWETQIETNIRGPIIGTLLGMQYMSKTSSGEGGTIVNVGSLMGIIPSFGFPIHTFTQFGIAGFSRALGSEKLYQRTGIRIFGYCPAFTNTNALKLIENKAINKNFAAEFEEELKKTGLQEPFVVAKGLIDILGVAKPGSLWIAEDNKDPYEMEFPKISEKKEVQELKPESQSTNSQLEQPNK